MSLRGVVRIRAASTFGSSALALVSGCLLSGCLLSGCLLSGCGGAAEPPATPASEPEALLADAPAEAPPSAELQKGTAAIQAGDFAGAKKILGDVVAKSPGNAQAQFYYGVAQHNLNEAEGAIAAYEKAVSLDAGLGEAWVNLSAVMLDTGRAQDALPVIERGLKRHPKHAELLYNRALALKELERPKEAVPAFADAVAANPANAEAKFGYAEALAQSGDNAKAIDVLKSLVSADNVEILASSGRLLGGLKAFDTCVEALNKALNLKLSSELYVQRGLCKHGAKDEAGALADFELAVKQDGSFAPAYYYLGMHLKSQGKKAKARQALSKAAELAGDTGVGAAAKKALSSL